MTDKEKYFQEPPPSYSEIDEITFEAVAGPSFSPERMPLLQPQEILQAPFPLETTFHTISNEFSYPGAVFQTGAVVAPAPRIFLASYTSNNSLVPVRMENGNMYISTREPVVMHCPFCNTFTTTTLRYQATTCAWISCVTICALLPSCLCFLPFCMSVPCTEGVHSCSRCFTKLAIVSQSNRI